MYLNEEIQKHQDIPPRNILHSIQFTCLPPDWSKYPLSHTQRLTIGRHHLLGWDARLPLVRIVILPAIWPGELIKRDTWSRDAQ